MSMEDPFFVVKGEVQKEVQAAQALHHRWRELTQEVGGASRLDVGGASREEVDWTTNELRNCLRSIEWDLEDLEETVSIVESNPKKFNLEETELKTRKNFIASTRTTVQAMKDQMLGPAGPPDRQTRVQVLQGDSGSQGPIWQPQYQRLDRQLETANAHFIQEQQTQQQLMAEQQDEQLQLVSGTIGVLKNMSEQIGLELDQQAGMLEDLTQEVETSQTRLDHVMKKLAKVSHMTSDRRQWCAIGVLLVLLFIVVLLFFIL